MSTLLWKNLTLEKETLTWCYESSLGFSLFSSSSLLNIFHLSVFYAHSCVFSSEIAVPNMSVHSHCSSDTFSTWSRASGSTFAPQGTFWPALDVETDYYGWVYSYFYSQKYQFPDMKALSGTHWDEKLLEWGRWHPAGARPAGPAQGTATYSKSCFPDMGSGRGVVSGLQNSSSLQKRRGNHRF